MSETILTDSNFEQEVIKSDIPVLVDFWAPWCGPCQMMGPVIEELAKEYVGRKIKIAKLNVDDSSETASKYNVLSIPTFLIFKNGQVVDQMVGGVTKEKIKQMIEKYV